MTVDSSVNQFQTLPLGNYFPKQILLQEDVLCVTSLMEVSKDRDTVASRILNVFRHQEEHHNLLKRLTDREIENEGG